MRKKPRKELFSIYLNAFIRSLEEGIEKCKSDDDLVTSVSKSIFYGVKAINTMPEVNDFESIRDHFVLITQLKGYMSLLTPGQFMNVFPIEKSYDGDRFGIKDYFYTMEYIKTLNPNEPIGEKILEFLMEYMNWDIHIFQVNMLGYLSDLRRFEGKQGVFEEFAAENGVHGQTTHEGVNGAKYLIDSRGKTTKLQEKKKRMPKHLKVLK